MAAQEQGFRVRDEAPQGPGDDRSATLRAETVEVSLAPDAKEPKATATPGFSDAGNSASDETRELVRAYYQTFR